jgi:electron transfer flavoprotein beta subunit
MKILICIKPDITGQEIGRLEALAIEAGLKLKDSDGRSRVDVITVGPQQWENVLRRALGMGADNAFHLLTKPGEKSIGGLVSASETSELLTRALTCREFIPEYDLILTGLISQDLMAGEVGPMLAAYMGIPLATAVVRLTYEDGRLIGYKDWEGGKKEIIEIPSPALVSIQAGHYTPRYPSLSNILKAASVGIETRTPANLERTNIPPDMIFQDITEPQKTRVGQLVIGNIEMQVRTFTTFLHERALL